MGLSKKLSFSEYIEVDGVTLTGIHPKGEAANIPIEWNPFGSKAAIVVRNAEKCYNPGKSEDAQILKRLNMRVPAGCIYSLLGSSGAGKSTLLSCMLGIRELDRGSVHIFGVESGTKRCREMGVPGRLVGYMPQDICLNPELTIDETLELSGRLCGLSPKQTEVARGFLTDLLELPDGFRKVRSLSGGQQRRVSFATALIHEPPLIILDEPSVGVDPILRQRLWDHLRHLVTRKESTVIVTTHYMEEARQGDMIGILRDGKIIAETCPEELISYYQAESLQEAVLTLCKNGTDKEGKIFMNSFDVDEIPIGVTCDQGLSMAAVPHGAECSPVLESLGRIPVLVRKNLRVLRRNYGLALFVTLIPLVSMTVNWVSFGHDPMDVSVGVVNHELSSENITSCSLVPPQEFDECDLNLLSCKYLQILPQNYLHLIEFDSEADAKAAVERGHAWGYLTFQSNFSDSIFERAIMGSDVTDEILDGSNIKVHLDNTNKILSLFLQLNLLDGLVTFSKRLLRSCGEDPRNGDLPLIFGEPLNGHLGLEMQAYTGAGSSILLLFFFPIISTGIRLIEERRSGTMERLLVHGVNAWEILIAYTISEFIVLFLQTVLVYGLLTQVLGLHVVGSSALALILMFLSGYVGLSIGLFLGSLCTEKIHIAVITIAVYIPNLILSGVYWPVEGMPNGLRMVSSFLPCTLPTESLRSVMNRGWELTHPNVWPGLVVLVAYIVCFNTLAIWCYRKALKK